MGNILVFVECSEQGFKKGSLELLTAAKGSGRAVHALLVGPKAKEFAAQTGEYGASAAWLCADEKLKHYNPELYTLAVCTAVESSQADLILASASMLAKDLFPRVGARLNSGVASDCTNLEISGSSLRVRRPLYSGKCTAEVEFVDSPVKIVLMRANQLPVGPASSGTKAAVNEIILPAVAAKTEVKDVVRGSSNKIDLTEANVIVAGGRGMKGPEHFQLLEELATTVHGTVGASRAVADAGWVPHSLQVGQTGKTVAPSLYIACGISGAIQHLAGMSGSKVIVAINKDAEAPIFQKATYGVVGDLFEVVPKLNEALKSLLK